MPDVGFIGLPLSAGTASYFCISDAGQAFDNKHTVELTSTEPEMKGQTVGCGVSSPDAGRLVAKWPGVNPTSSTHGGTREVDITITVKDGTGKVVAGYPKTQKMTIIQSGDIPK
jgi:hypothetical protein